MFELITNEMILLPISRKFGVHISFNVTSYLKYGPGIKIVEGAALNKVFKWAAEYIPGLKNLNKMN